MPVETTPASNSTVVITQSDAQNVKQSVTKRSLLAVLFVGLSASVFTAEALDFVRIDGGLTTIKLLTSILAGFVGGFATAHTGLFRRDKSK